MTPRLLGSRRHVSEIEARTQSELWLFRTATRHRTSVKSRNIRSLLDACARRSTTWSARSRLALSRNVMMRSSSLRGSSGAVCSETQVPYVHQSFITQYRLPQAGKYHVQYGVAIIRRKFCLGGLDALKMALL